MRSFAGPNHRAANSSSSNDQVVTLFTNRGLNVRLAGCCSGGGGFANYGPNVVVGVCGPAAVVVPGVRAIRVCVGADYGVDGPLVACRFGGGLPVVFCARWLSGGRYGGGVTDGRLDEV